MNKLLVIFATLVIVAAALAGGTAFIMQQNKLNNFKRRSALAEEKMAANAYDEAIPILRRIESEGGTPQSAFLLGKALYAQGDLASAMKYFDQVEVKFPKSPFVAQAALYKARHALETTTDKKAARDLFIGILQKYNDPDVADQALYQLAKISYDEGDIPQAKKNLETITRKAESPAKNDAEFLLGDINMKQLRSPEPGPDDTIYTIKKGDNLISMERRLKVPMDVLMGINNLKPTGLVVGQQIKAPNLQLAIIIDKAQRTLTVKNHGQFLKKYHVGINHDDKMIATGDFQVSGKEDKGRDYTDPTNNVTSKAGAPDNPLGTRFISFRRDLGIHGTNNPAVVGTYTSKGYVTMTNADIEELYSLVSSKEKITVTVKGHNLLEDSTASKKP